jgi:hypothetical protein
MLRGTRASSGVTWRENRLWSTRASAGLVGRKHRLRIKFLASRTNEYDLDFTIWKYCYARDHVGTFTLILSVKDQPFRVVLHFDFRTLAVGRRKLRAATELESLVLSELTPHSCDIQYNLNFCWALFRCTSCESQSSWRTNFLPVTANWMPIVF